MKIFFVFNPKAGQEKIKKRLGEIIELFSVRGCKITVAATTKRGDAREWVMQLPDNEYDRVICAGGDGTLDEVVQGMMERKEKLPIGYIPAGSTNDFAKSLGLPVRLMDAVETAISDNLFSCDIGKFNDKAFVYVAAFGAFTEVSYGTPQDVKNLLGHTAYVLEGIKHVSEIKSVRMHVESGNMVIDDEFLFGMITNSDSIGGFKNITGKNIVLNDGLFEVTLIRKPTNAFELNQAIAGLMNRELAAKGLYYFKTDSVSFTSEEGVSWTLDGEFGGTVTKVNIQNHNKALQFAVK